MYKQKRSATQRLSEMIQLLITLRDELEATENENSELINYAYNNNLPALFANLTEQINKEIKRIYYSK